MNTRISNKLVWIEQSIQAGFFFYVFSKTFSPGGEKSLLPGAIGEEYEVKKEIEVNKEMIGGRFLVYTGQDTCRFFLQVSCVPTKCFCQTCRKCASDTFSG